MSLLLKTHNYSLNYCQKSTLMHALPNLKLKTKILKKIFHFKHLFRENVHSSLHVVISLLLTSIARREGKKTNGKPQTRGRRSDLSVRQQTAVATPLCLCLCAGACWLNSRRSSWLKGTKPHRNTWLGSVWPATARRVASAAWARESRRNGGSCGEEGKGKVTGGLVEDAGKRGGRRKWRRQQGGNKRVDLIWGQLSRPLQSYLMGHKERKSSLRLTHVAP